MAPPRNPKTPKGQGGGGGKKPPANPRTAAGRGGSRSPWDIVPGTHADERFGPFFAVLLFALVGTWLNRSYTDPSAVGLIIFYFLLLAGVMGWLAWRVAHGRDDVVRIHLGITVAAAFASLAGWLLNGWSHPWADIYFFIGLPLAGSWVLYTLSAVKGDGTDAHPEAEGSLDDMVKNARRLKHRLIEEDGPRLVYRLEHTGATTAEIQSTAESLASHAGIPITGVRVTPDPDRADVSYVTMVAEDVLKTPIDFPGLSAPGQTCAIPSRVGVYEDSKPLEIVRPGDPETGRPALRILIGGMPGAGKTEGELVELAELTSRKDVVVWWADPIKGAQTAPAFRPAIDWFADGQQECEAMVGALDDVIKARANLLGKLGYRQWEPEVYEKHGIPFMVIHFEEATRLLDQVGKSMTRMAEAVRSAGISISVSLQRPSHTNMPSDLRSQLGVGWCYGAQTAVDATMILSDDTIGAGARPESWKDTKPGYNYLEASHVPQSRWSVPARTFRMSAKVLIAIVREWAPRMAKLDPWTQEAAGPAYASRNQMDFAAWEAEMDAVHGEGTTKPTGTLPPVPTTHPAGNPDGTDQPVSAGTVSRETGTEGNPEGETMTDIRQSLVDLHKDDETPIPEDVDANNPLAAPDEALANFRFSEPDTSDYTPEQRAQAFREVLVSFAEEGVREVTVRMVQDRFKKRPEAIGKSGKPMTPGWHYYRLSTIAQDPHAFLVEKYDTEGRPMTPRTWMIGNHVGSSPLVVPENDPELWEGETPPPGAPSPR